MTKFIAQSSFTVAINIHVCTLIYLTLCTHICICLYTYTCVCIYVCTCIYVHSYIYRYIHICICIYAYTRWSKSRWNRFVLLYYITVTVEKYLDILMNHVVLQLDNNLIHITFIFNKMGPLHIIHGQSERILKQFLRNGFGRRGLIDLPTCLPALTSMDFFLLGSTQANRL